MRRMQEITDVPDQYVDCIDTYISSIKDLPLPYTGNKKKLLHNIHASLTANDVEFGSVVDAFSGSASVSLLFKFMGKRVISNDLLTSSYINSVAFVENPGVKLSKEEQEFLLHNENPNKGDFVEKNYLGKEFRDQSPDNQSRWSKFTLTEARHLDNFRANVDEICGMHAQSVSLAANAAVVMRLPFGQVDASDDVLKHRVKQESAYGKQDRRIGIYYDERYNLDFNKWFRKYAEDFTRGNKLPSCDAKYKHSQFLANLQQHVMRDCVVSGRLNEGQSLAEVKNRLAHPKNQLKAKMSNGGSTEMDFFTRIGTGEMEGRPGEGLKFWNFAHVKLPGECLATNMDATELFKSGICNGVDAVYFDPPYGGQSSNYAGIYRFFEEYIYGCTLEEMLHIQASAKKFAGGRRYEENFIEMLESARDIPVWLFSYNDQSWKDIEYICDIIRQFGKNVVVDVLSSEYRYLYSKCQGRKNRRQEYLIIAR